MTLSKEAKNICLAGVSKSPTTQYKSFINQFEDFCMNKGVSNFLNTSVEVGIEFLTHLFNKGKSYSTINTARSTLSQYITVKGVSKDIDFGKHSLTIKSVRGVFKSRPPKTKYNTTWDVKLVLDLFRNKTNDELSLKDLTVKCVMLLALSTGQRAKTLTALDLSNLHENEVENKITFTFDKILKTSRPGFTHIVEIHTFDEEPNICPLLCLQKYIEKTKSFRKSNQLFISFQKPHKAVTTQTISRWLCSVLSEADINKCFKAHSTRNATSKAAKSLEINTILKTLGWSREATFAKHYRRSTSDIRKNFTNTILPN